MSPCGVDYVDIRMSTGRGDGAAFVRAVAAAVADVAGPDAARVAVAALRDRWGGQAGYVGRRRLPDRLPGSAPAADVAAAVAAHRAAAVASAPGGRWDRWRVAWDAAARRGDVRPAACAPAGCSPGRLPDAAPA